MKEEIHSETDVLIIGAGPAGLMAALWLTKCGIDVRIVDRRATKVFRGQADSLQVRTMEIFDSFGMADGINRDGSHLLESSFWTSEGDKPIELVGTSPEYYPELSRFYQVVINQGRTEREFLDTIKRVSGVEVERGVQPIKLEIDETNLEDPQSRAVKVTLDHLSAEELASSPWSLPLPKVGDFNFSAGDEAELETGRNPKAGMREIVSAKYVIGSDGARSWTRKQLGFKFEGDGVDPLWGIMDMVVKTDFPDARKRAVINTPHGSCFFIGRENGMTRLAVKLDGLDRSQVTPEIMLPRIQDIIKPYKVECLHYDWHAVYQSNQRLSNGVSKLNRVFLAGDAIHTHSPKAGVGMNFSLQDTYNLGWKLVHVLKGFAKPSLLDTYAAERLQVANELIKFDKYLSAALLGTSSTASLIEQSQKSFEVGLPFTSCTALKYNPGPIVATSKSQPEIAKGLVLGQRFPSQVVENHASGHPVELQSRFLSNGKYRVVVFGGDISCPEQFARVKAFGEAVADRKSFARFEKTEGELFEVLLVHAAQRRGVKWEDIPAVFRPWRGSTGTWYDGVWTDRLEYVNGPGRAYDGYGIDRKQGCLVLVRPDGHVMFVNDLESLVNLEDLLGDVLIVQK